MRPSFDGRSNDAHPLFAYKRASPNDVFTSFWDLAGSPDRQPSFRARGPKIPRARPSFTCIATLFGALHASLFKAKRLPDDFCNCCVVRALTGALDVLAGRIKGHDLLPFLTHHVLRAVLVSFRRREQRTRPKSDARRAARVAVRSTPRSVPPRWFSAGFARSRYRIERCLAFAFACAHARVRGASEGRVLLRVTVTSGRARSACA